MADSTYSVEFAKSGRGKCHKCKLPIEKDALRIVANMDSGGKGYHMSQNSHPLCFNLPRKYATGANKITVEDFLDDVLHDASNGEILPARRDELIEAISTKASKKKVEEDTTSYYAQVKAAYEAGDDDDADIKPKAAKKAKIEEQKKDEYPLPPIHDDTTLSTYGEICKFKNDAFKDELKWNRQMTSGTKPYLLTKVLDGRVRGRFALCSVCDGGKLKLDEEGRKVTCNGRYDEDRGMRVTCNYTASVLDAPRWEPWYTAEPSKEEMDEMDARETEITGEEVVRDEEGNRIKKGDLDVTGAAASKKKSGDEQALVEAVMAQMADKEWNLASKSGLQKAAKELLAVLQSIKEPALDLPENETAAKQGVGKWMAKNRQASVEEIVMDVAREFGFAEAKKKKAAKKEAALTESLKCPENAPIVAVLKELADLYFNEGNRNAGISYNKVVAAVSDLDYEITEDNALGLGKGKTKVANIGKSSAEKIHEFMTTGKIEKLEEKRALAAS